ncbi:MAG: aminodeoxychorismate synthase component I [Ignavibacterium sp.]
MYSLDEILLKVSTIPNSAFFYTPSIYKNASSYLFLKYQKSVFIQNKSDIERKLKLIDKLMVEGFQGFGLINYEFGYLLEQKLVHLLNNNSKNLLSFFFFNENNILKIKSSQINLNYDFKISDYKISNFKLNTTQKSYINSIDKIKNYIEIGDTYQVNYTIKSKFNISGNLISFFKNLIFNQSAEFIAFINLANQIIISLSPELFFSVKKNDILVKPMKGTISRGINLYEDEINKSVLINSSKDKAENIMIVDLLRNDLGKISEFNSVKTTKLFALEKYESIYQMTSTIQSKLKKNIKFSEILKNIFPSGSITGAPKIRTMEIIKSLEKENRNIYTGSIGLFVRDKIVFNIAIRTLEIDKNNYKTELGLGSGIVWDSDPISEFNEAKLKGKFLINPLNYFEIFESVLFEEGKLFLWNEHLDRLRKTANYFLFVFDEKKITNQIKKVIDTLNYSHKYKLKIVLTKFGKIKIEVEKISEELNNLSVIVSKKFINSKNVFQYFKTTNRKLYDSELKKYKSKGFEEIIFLNEKGEITEGSFTNIFIKKNDIYFTSPINSGILSGVYRKYFLIKNANSREMKLSIQDLINASEIILVNSVRKEMKVKKLFLNENEFKSFLV